MIILMGMTGSGKSTQAGLLAEKLNSPWVSSGQLLREEKDKGKYQTMLKGQLVSDEIMFPLVEEKLKSLDWGKQEIILEGFPRTIDQAKWLVNKIRNGETFLSVIVHINVPRETVLKRLLARGRADDNEASINKRFEEYEQRTLPILDYFNQENFKVVEVKGDKSISEIQAGIVNLLETP